MTALTVAEILSGASLGLASGLDDLLVLEIDGQPVLYALNRAESRLIEVSVGSAGGLTPDGSLGVSGTIAPASVARLTQASHGSGSEFLAIAGIAPSDGQRVTLTATGALGTQETLGGVGMLTHPVGLQVGGMPVLLSGGASGGLVHYVDVGSGYVEGIGLADASDRYLADIAASTSFEAQGVTYVATASAAEHGVNIAAVTASGLTQTGGLGAADSLPISTPTDLAAIEQLGNTYLVVASFGTSSLSVLTADDGIPTLTDHIYDSDATRFQGAKALAVTTHGDFAFVATGGAEGGVSLMTVLPGGRLVHLDSVVEDETVPLGNIQALEIYVEADALQLVTGSGNEPGLA
ncbi:MAG: hypothetical protein AAGF56_15075, partial [Pseudomonadota bacterium]